MNSQKADVRCGRERRGRCPSQNSSFLWPIVIPAVPAGAGAGAGDFSETIMLELSPAGCILDTWLNLLIAFCRKMLGLSS